MESDDGKTGMTSGVLPYSSTAPVRPHARRLAPRRGLKPISVAVVLVAVGGIALLGYYVSLPAAAIVYALGYMLLTWVRPDLALFVMFASAAFPYDLGGGPVKMAMAEINLALATPVLIIRAIQRRLPRVKNPIKWPILAYLAVCVISSLHNGLERDAIVSMAQMALYLLLAVFIFSWAVQDVILYRAALAGLLFSGAFFAAAEVVSHHGGYILGIHKNAVGNTLSYAVIVCGEFWFAETDHGHRRRLGLLGCMLVGGLLFSLSRGAWVGAALGLAVVALLRSQFNILFRGLLVSTIVIVLLWQLLPQNQQAYATSVSADAYNVKTRLVSIKYAMSYFEGNPVFGVGVGLRKQYDATNVIASTLAETGISGLAAFLSIFVVLALSIWRAHRRVAPDDPTFSLLVIGGALALCQFVHGCVDHYWARALLIPWGGVGMALYARQLALRRSLQRGGQ